MSSEDRPKVVGAGLIALDFVIGSDAEAPIRHWAGGTCGNVLSILAYLNWDAYPIARMNGDVASQHVCADMERWGVHLDWIDCAPTTHSPIVVHRIQRDKDGRSAHRFSWMCPNCGECLPAFKPITVDAVEQIKPTLVGTSAFFFDRLSRGTLMLAAEAAAGGAVVVFEPSGRGNAKLLAEALRVSHVVKYAGDRLSSLPGMMEDGCATLLEIQTLGTQGLRYRHRLGRGTSNWIHLKSVAAPRVVDACGSGDWCTAGLISKAAVAGWEGLRCSGAQGVRSALQYGQALAAWNCGFEGARGGMYSVSRGTLASQASRLLHGQCDGVGNTLDESVVTDVVTCPSCPPSVSAAL